MNYEQRALFYADSISKAVMEALRAAEGIETPLDDDTRQMVILRDTLRRLADEAEGRINIKAQTAALLGLVE